MRLLLGLGILVGLPAVAAAAISVKADAGLAGLSRPGRWTPVRVVVHFDQDAGALDRSTEDVVGELVVEWGEASVKRAVALTPGSRRQFELYLRSSEPRATMVVSIVAAGVVRASVEAPVATTSFDAPVTVCVASENTTPHSSAACSSTTSESRLPRSPRGYDAADRVVWLTGDQAELSAEQRVALAQWEALKRLEDEGDMASVPGVPSTVPGIAGRLRIRGSMAMVVAFYAVSLLGLWPIVRRAPALAAYPTLVLISGAAFAAATMAGQIGPASDVVVHHASVVHQFAGASGSLVSMRAVAEYPAFEAAGLRADVRDAAIEWTSARGESEQFLDESGYSRLTGVFGLGARQPFALETITDLQLLAVVRRGRAVRLSNTSTSPLRNCRLPVGFSPQSVDLIAPGASVDVVESGLSDSGALTCVFDTSPVAFVDEQHPSRAVRTEGRSVLAASLRLDEASN